MKHILLVIFMSLSFSTITAHGAVTTRKHERVLEVPLVEVLDALGLTVERGNFPKFHIDGSDLIIIVQGAGN